MRVITGSARGCRLQTLEGNDVRPTTERVKEAMFSAIQFDIEGRRVLDLFAGSGQLGIEALSRGAENAVFIDNSNKSLDVVRRNLTAARLDDKAKVINTDFASYLSMTPDRFDIVFIDPPYSTGMVEQALSLIPRVMSEYGIIICEHPCDEQLPDSIDGFSIHKFYKFGKLAFSIYRPSK